MLPEVSLTVPKLSEIERTCASGFRMTRRHTVHAAMPFLPVFAYTCHVKSLRERCRPKVCLTVPKLPEIERACASGAAMPFLPAFAYTSYAKYLLRRCCPKVGRTVPKLPVIERAWASGLRTTCRHAVRAAMRARLYLRRSNACFCQYLPILPMPNISSRDASQKSA